MSTNHRLKIQGTDNGIWRRIHELPFTVKFSPDRQDPRLAEALREEAPGIFAWAVRGCLEWQRMGLNPPEIVRRATESYRTEMDVIGQFLKEATLPSKGKKLPKADAYQAYVEWAASSGNEEVTKKELGKRMKAAGVAEGRTGSKGHYWEGIQLVDAGPIEPVSEGAAW
jgi:putative DNA primase/helicase